MDNIKDLVYQAIDQLGQRQALDHGKGERIWQQMIKPRELRHTRFDGIQKGVMYINVDSPAMLFSMKTKQTRILKAVKEELPEIEKIRFKIGKIS